MSRRARKLLQLARRLLECGYDVDFVIRPVKAAKGKVVLIFPDKGPVDKDLKSFDEIADYIEENL